MRSAKQVQASRANGAKSRGPNTPRGKEVSSQNALRHGLLSGSIVLEEESESRFQDLLDAYLEEFQPATASEMSLVENLAIARWKQFRVWGVQKCSIDRDMAVQHSRTAPPAFRAAYALQGRFDSAISPATAVRYETLYANQFNRTLRHLLQLQNRRFRPVRPDEPALSSGNTWKDARPDTTEIEEPNGAKLPHSTSPIPNEPEK
jgi:hypothetical protein